MENTKDSSPQVRDETNDTDNNEVEILKIAKGTSPKNNDFSFLEYFKSKNHSLSINASSVAACVGYHEFQSLPELMLKHVYQGGQTLLEHDAKLLGLELATDKDEEAELLKLAESSGSTKAMQAVQTALNIKHGDHHLKSVEEAHKLKNIISEEAKNLAPHQRRQLQESTRQAIDTGCGHSWEEQALDRYQEQCGWEVRERNSECRVWEFEILENDSSVPSIQPVGPAVPRKRKTNHRLESDNNNNNNDNINQHRYDSRGVKRKLPSSYDSQISQAALQDFSVKDVDMATIEEASAEQSDFISIDDHSASRHHQQHDELSSSTTQSQKPFVTIKGMVDGIRDELGPTTWNETCGNNNNNNNDNNDDHDDNLSCESYSLSRVVVECKHRMNKLLHGPRFSECIQAVVYCFMYEADDADIVQVLRTKNDATKSAIKEGSVTKYFRKVAQGHGQTEGGTVQDEKKKVIEKTTENQDIKGDGDATDEATATKPRIEEQDKKETTENNIAMTIAIDRVSLDDPNFGHRANWKAIILPKLRQWVDAVYRIRQSDDKRYRLLTALSMVDSLDAANERKYLKAAWELVFEECDFLREGMSGERYRRETQ